MFYRQTIKALKMSIGPKSCESWEVQYAMALILQKLDHAENYHTALTSGQTSKSKILAGPQDLIDGVNIWIDNLADLICTLDKLAIL